MKKFVGLVNGKSFDNEEDWKKAANEAIKDNDGNLAITSYYSYNNDEENEEEDSNYVNTNEYYLGDRKPDSVTDGGTVVEYNIDDDLVKRIRESINRDSIKRKLEYQINNLGDSITRDENKILSLQTDIEELNKKIEVNRKLINTLENDKYNLKGRYKYYSTLLERISEEKEVKEEKKEETQKPLEERRSSFEDALKSFGSMTLYDIFKKHGLIV